MTWLMGTLAIVAIVAFVLWMGHRHPRWRFRRTLKYIRSLPTYHRKD